MSSRTVKVTLDAKVDGLVNGLRTAKKATGDFTRDLGAWRSKNEEHLDTLGDAAGKSGLAITAGLGLVGKAAMDWQSDWTGVLKTVEGTPAELGKVENGLRGLAKTLPASHREIAGVAEAAGQLGVATGDVVDFTKVMIDLGESTNMSADVAATQLARFSNIMGTSTDDVGRLGATIVGLGNNFATTESEIMDMSMRLAGASKQIGLSEGQTMGLAAAMSSVGIEAEAGGSAMSMTMKKVSKAVDGGGKSLETFASVSGMTAEQFATLWKKDASAGLEAFVLGLGKAGDEGESVNAILTELGITGIRESDALLRLSSAGELMGNSMKQGSQEFADGSALIEEATKRYETAESKVKMAWNGIKDAAITAGASLLPVIANIAEGVSGLADWFSSIPAPIQGFVVALGTIAGSGLLAISGMIMLSKKANELTTAFGAIAPAGGRAAKGIDAVSKGLSGAMVVGFALVAGKSIIEGINEAARSGQPDLEAYFNLLATGGGAGVVKGLDFKDTGGALFGPSELQAYKQGLGDITDEAGAAKRAIEYLGADVWEPVRWASDNLSFGGLRDAANDANKLETAMGALGRSFEMGEIGKSQQAFADIASQLSLTDEEIGTLINSVPELKSALMGIATDGGIEIDPNDELGLVDLALGRIAVSGPGAADALGQVGAAGSSAADGLAGAESSIRGVAMSAEEAETAVKDFYDGLVAIGAIALSERDALRGLEESFDAAAEAAKKNGKTLDTTTEKGRANEAALDGIASATLSAVEAQEAQGRSAGDLAATMEAGRDAYIKQAVAMGMPKKAAEELANSLNLIPNSVFMEFGTNAEGVSARVQELYDWVKAAPDGKIQIEDNSPEVRATLEALGFVVKTLPNGMIEVSEKGAAATGQKIDGVAGKKRDAKITTAAITAAAEAALNHLARDRSSTIHTRFTSSGASAVERGGSGGQTGNYLGGRVGSYKNGGRLPYTGLGRDMIMGVGSDGRPTANVDDGEWVINEKSSSKHDALLAMINRNDPRIDQMKSLVGLAKGGKVGAAEKRVASTKRAYELIDGKQANRLRKLAAKDQYDAAKKELADAKKSSKASEAAAKKAETARKKAAEDEKARQGRLGDSRRELGTDLRRGNIVDAFTSGSGMGQVDKLYDASRNQDYSKGKRQGLARDAKALEKSLTILTKKSEGLKVALESATKQADELRSVRDSVAGDLRGEFSLSGMLGDARRDLGAAPVTARSIGQRANKMARNIEIFAGRLNRLRKMGYGETIIQEVAGLGTTDGTIVAGVLMNATKGEKSSIVKAYDRLDTASGKAGQYVTESMYMGGLDAADGLVRGLESKQKNVDDAFFNLGKSAEKSFKRSLGIKSPSKVMFGAGVNVGEGAELGILSKVGDVSGAAEQLMAMPALSIPPSAEVARYAAQPAQQGFQMDYALLAQEVVKAAAAAQPVDVQIDGRSVVKAIRIAEQQHAKRR